MRLYKTEYKVLEDMRISDLMNQVNYWLAEGWECQGGIAIFHNHSFYSNMFFQAMIKRMFTSE